MNLRIESAPRAVPAPGAPVPDPIANPIARPWDDERLFSLAPATSADGAAPLWRRFYERSAPSLDRLLGLDKINAVYSHCGGEGVEPAEFVGRCLDYLRVRGVVSDEDLARVPKTGPLVVVSNHPVGA